MAGAKKPAPKKKAKRKDALAKGAAANGVDTPVKLRGKMRPNNDANRRPRNRGRS